MTSFGPIAMVGCLWLLGALSLMLFLDRSFLSSLFASSCLLYFAWTLLREDQRD